MQTERTTLSDRKESFIDLENTELAFRDLSDSSLKQAYQLFKVMNSRNLVKTGEFLVKLAFAIHFPVKGILRKTIYRHFVGGMSILDSSKTIAQLGRRNVDSILDYALEVKIRMSCSTQLVMKLFEQLNLPLTAKMCL